MLCGNLRVDRVCWLVIDLCPVLDLHWFKEADKFVFLFLLCIMYTVVTSLVMGVANLIVRSI